MNDTIFSGNEQQKVYKQSKIALSQIDLKGRIETVLGNHFPQLQCIMMK